jgi:hypothetical protein
LCKATILTFIRKELRTVINLLLDLDPGTDRRTFERVPGGRSYVGGTGRRVLRPTAATECKRRQNEYFK